MNSLHDFCNRIDQLDNKKTNHLNTELCNL